MPTRKTQLATMLASLFVLLIVLLFNAWLNMSALKKNYVTSLVGSYTVAGGECRRKIEYAVRYGKPLDNFYGMKELLQEVKKDAAELDDVRVVGLDGSLKYDLQGKASGRLPARLLKEADFKTSLRTSPVIRFEGNYELFIPIHDRQGSCIGLLNLVFDEAMVTNSVQLFWQQNLREMLLVAVLAVILLGVALFAVPVVSKTGTVRNKRIFAILLIVLGAAQLYYGFSNIALLKGMYFDIARKNIQLSGHIMQKDINLVLQKGVPFSELRGVDAWFENIMHMLPETGQISVSDAHGTARYSAGAQAGRASPSSYAYSFPLIRSADGEDGTLQVVLSQAYINAKLKDVRLDVLTILVTSFFLTIELIVFLLFILNAKAGSSGPGTQTPAGLQYIRIIRPLAFLFFIVFDMSISFIPVYMKKLYEPLLGLPKDIVLGLPISAEMFFIALSSYAAGLMIDKKGWRQPFYLGLVIVALGVLLSALAQNALFFIVARGVIGIGYGLTLVAMEGYLLSSPAKDARMAGFSQLYAGLYAGKLCAAALGAMLAERLGYAAVFVIQIAMLAVPLLFALSFTKDRSVQPATPRPVAVTTQGSLRQFVCNRQIITFFLLITLPSMVCTVGFLCYFFPLYANSIGVSTSNTGRAFMIYGICFIMLGPWFGVYLGKRSNAMHYVYGAGGIGVAAMLVFFWQGSFISALIAIFLLGLADTVNSVAQTGYFLNMEATHAFGEGKGLGLLRLARKIGEAIGPIAFGWLLMFGTQTGVGLAGGIYLVIMLVFMLLTRLYGTPARTVGQ